MSDIISKTLGGLILFEPDHPLVCEKSEEWIYSSRLPQEELERHIHAMLLKSNRDPWLLRNHLPDNHREPSLIDMIWDRSRIIGLKCIRWNHDLPTLSAISGGRLIYIIRNPLAVVASLLKRDRFFAEYSWEWHWDTFKSRHPLIEIDIQEYDSAEKYLKYAVMWTVSNMKALSDLHTEGHPYIAYEHLYRNPYEQSKRILKILGYTDVDIHPSYLFYPSMSTLRTFHSDSERFSLINDGLDFFWQDDLSEDQIEKIRELVSSLSLNYPSVYATFKTLNYI